MLVLLLPYQLNHLDNDIALHNVQEALDDPCEILGSVQWGDIILKER